MVSLQNDALVPEPDDTVCLTVGADNNAEQQPVGTADLVQALPNKLIIFRRDFAAKAEALL